jgi:hypothetical protein
MKNGFYMVATLDRFNELEKVLKSLKKYHEEPVCVMIANDRYQAHEFKTLCGFYSPFDNTIMMDIDMYVLQNFGEVFDIVKDGKIALYEEHEWGIYNSGFVAFQKEIMEMVSLRWWELYVNKQLNKRHQWKGLWEQDILTNILKMRDCVKLSKHQIFNLPKFYNYCIYKFTPNQELEDWDKIKVLHYWYRSGNKPDPKRRSWQVWLGENTMTNTKPTLVDEIKRRLECFKEKPRLNARRIGLLESLLEFNEQVVEGKGKKEVKTWSELEEEKTKTAKPKKTKEEVKPVE